MTQPMAMSLTSVKTPQEVYFSSMPSCVGSVLGCWRFVRVPWAEPHSRFTLRDKASVAHRIDSAKMGGARHSAATV